MGDVQCSYKKYIYIYLVLIFFFKAQILDLNVSKLIIIKNGNLTHLTTFYFLI